MSTRLKEKEEKILQLLEHLADKSAKGALIIVEGKKDVETLRALGVEGRIIPAKSTGKAFIDVVSDVETMSEKEVILLFDFDRRGVQATKRFALPLEHVRMAPNLMFWRQLKALVGREVKDVEGLASYMENLKRKLSIP